MSEMELYIHIPFCMKKCNYCDFLSFSSKKEEREEYVEALCQEIRETGIHMGKDPLRSIFIGGGTPSILSCQQMERIMQTVKDHFSWNTPIEISMEANPGTLNKEKLIAYRKMGINRLSMGLQSTDDACLEKLGRIHNFAQFEENYSQARAAGFENINIDLMSALPGQTISSYENTLRVVASLQPEHISAYSLIIEEGTPFYEDDQLLDLLPDEDSERRMYEMTQDILMQYGYHRYEISNYAKEGKECVHNLGYWDDVPYLGVGLGASSYWNGSRFSNETSINRYIENPYIDIRHRLDYHVLTKEEKMEEYMFLGLRKRKGVSLKKFFDSFGCTMMDVYKVPIEKYINMSLLRLNGDQLCLTDAGIDVSNHILAEFLLN